MPSPIADRLDALHVAHAEPVPSVPLLGVRARRELSTLAAPPIKPALAATGTLAWGIFPFPAAAAAKERREAEEGQGEEKKKEIPLPPRTPPLEFFITPAPPIGDINVATRPALHRLAAASTRHGATPFYSEPHGRHPLHLAAGEP